MEAVFRPEVFEFFLVNFDHFLASANHFLVNYNHLFVNFRGKRQEVTGKISKYLGRNIASIFHLFLGVFLDDLVTFTPLSGGIHSFPKARIIDLGNNKNRFCSETEANFDVVGRAVSCGI